MSKAKIGKTYHTLPVSWQKEIEALINHFKMSEEDKKWFKKTGYFSISWNIIVCNTKYKCKAELENEEKIYNENEVKYSVKQGKKKIIKNGDENNFRNFLAVKIKQQLKGRR